MNNIQLIELTNSFEMPVKSEMCNFIIISKSGFRTRNTDTSYLVESQIQNQIIFNFIQTQHWWWMNANMNRRSAVNRIRFKHSARNVNKHEFERMSIEQTCPHWWMINTVSVKDWELHRILKHFFSIAFWAMPELWVNSKSSKNLIFFHLRLIQMRSFNGKMKPKVNLLNF